MSRKKFMFILEEAPYKRDMLEDLTRGTRTCILCRKPPVMTGILSVEDETVYKSVPSTNSHRKSEYPTLKELNIL